MARGQDKQLQLHVIIILQPPHPCLHVLEGTATREITHPFVSQSKSGKLPLDVVNEFGIRKTHVYSIRKRRCALIGIRRPTAVLQG